MRTETDTVFANPDGTLTRETSVAPVRMLKDGSAPHDYETGFTIPAGMTR
ncbi:hypothetical protein ACFWQ6_07835 [Streptomyces coelicoflavus]